MTSMGDKISDTEPDYAADVQDVYYDFALKIIDSPGYGRVALLKKVDNGLFLHKWPTSTPSWVPDWRIGSHNETPSTQFSSAISSTELPIRALKLSGFCFDSISVMKPDRTRYPSQDLYRWVTVEFWEQCVFPLEETGQLCGDVAPTIAFCDALVRGADQNSRQRLSPGTIAKAFLKWYEMKELNERLAVRRPEPRMVAFIMRRVEHLETNAEKQLLTLIPDAFKDSRSVRTLFLTKQNFIGLGPKAMRANDTVAFLEGDTTPFIIRAQDHFFQVVGPAYIPGLMNGEAFAAGVVEREIELR